MKKIATILTAVALLASNGAFAQQKSNKSMNTGKAAQAGKDCSYNSFAWGIGFGMLAVVAVVVGVSAGVGSGTPSTYSH